MAERFESVSINDINDTTSQGPYGVHGCRPALTLENIMTYTKRQILDAINDQRDRLSKLDASRKSKLHEKNIERLNEMLKRVLISEEVQLSEDEMELIRAPLQEIVNDL